MAGAPTSDLAGRTRDVRRAWAAPGSGHDRLIAAARRALPIAVGALTAILATAPFTSGRDISFVLAKDKVAIARERLRVSSALYRGEDDQGRAFALTAASAVQSSSSDPVVHLQGLTARIALNDGPGRLVAQRGRYDMDSRRIAIDGPVDFASANGDRMTTRDVLVDLDTKRLESRGAAQGSTNLGTFQGDRVSGDLETRVFHLDGAVRLHIVQSQFRARR